MTRAARRGRAATGLPALALVAALALACAVLAGDPGRRIDLGTDFTWEHLARAENISAEHGFIAFSRLWLDGDGIAYDPYNRFPVLGYLLVKLVTLPFPDDTAARVRAARALMLAFFAGAAGLAWLALRRLIGDDWAALGVVLLAFSSVQALRYADMVITEGVVDLFAVMLALHGGAVFATCGRFGQLLAKVCAALLLGWDVFALVGPLALLGLGAAMWRRDWRCARRHFTLAAVAVLFGAAVLGFNFAREHIALGGETPLAELPSVVSALDRSGLAPQRTLDWSRFAGEQLHRLGLASAPYPISHLAVGQGAGRPNWNPWTLGTAAAGGLFLLTTLALAVGARRPGRQARLTLLALALAGPCWILVMRHNAAHAHESLFHVGVPLAFFALALSRARARRAAGAAAAVGGAAFAGALLMAHALGDGERTRQVEALGRDIDAIRPLVAGRTILATTNYHYGTDNFAVLLHFLHGARATADPGLAEVVLRRGQLGLGDSLTPGNNAFHLYARRAWETAHQRYERLAAATPPGAAGGDYQVHWVVAPSGDELLVVRRDCPFAAGLPFGPHYDRPWRMGRVGVAWQEPAPFFAHVHPAALNALPSSRQAHGFDNLPFPHRQWVWRGGGDCYSVRALPGYAIASIKVGQFRRRGANRYENVWAATITPTGAPAQRRQAPPAGGTPALRAPP